jgi:hypothetical protein
MEKIIKICKICKDLGRSSLLYLATNFKGTPAPLEPYMGRRYVIRTFKK